MANSIKIYPVLRAVHFYAAALSGVFLLLFFLTGFLIVRYSWYDHEEQEAITETVQKDIPGNMTDRELANWVKSELEVEGKIDWINRRKDGSLMVEIVTPRTFNMLTIKPESNEIVYETRAQTLFESLSVMHRMHGYGGGFWYDVYLFFMDLASFSLLIFAVTGLYLWLKVIKRKWLGIVFLLLGLGYTMWVVMTFLN